MSSEVLHFEPDPNVLIALTHTPLRPLDALCELVDNGLDSFRAADLIGSPVAHPLLEITIPGAAEARRGEGVVRVVDNGAGLDREGLANALRAGYSDKNRYDTLGLFGMGFNIATGKLGRRTVVTTARRADDYALRVVVDLPEVVRSGRFEAPVGRGPKPTNFEHGTIIEVSDWWPSGHPNGGFITDLAGIGKPQLRQQLGRRYASILRRDDAERRVRILLNGESVEGFEHCVWSASRFVERAAWGMVPARVALNSVIFSQRRCLHDGTVIDEQIDHCLECGRMEFRTLEERVSGWVGIQRFDDNNRFGIDLIRNGRAIRISEKDAFFSFTSDLESVKEYPTDQQTGRIVGEIHLDHVPVDFQKQDFQRSSEEWQRAMQFLRGGSLLPSNWPDGERNETPVSKLFQGYRKVRNIGRADMYMGRYDVNARKAVRIGREVEDEYYQRFLSREDGYYDDAQWWELVETATIPPLQQLEECPDCSYQNLPEDDECGGCGRIIHDKECLFCHEHIKKSASSCPHCGGSQIPEVREPWRCLVCGETNGVDDERCGRCDALRGVENPVSFDVLRRDGEVLPELSFDNRTIFLADGHASEPLTVQAYRVPPLRPAWDGETVPAIASKSAGKIDVFLDTTHPSFTQLGVRPEETVAVEAAQYFYMMRPDLAGRPAHSVSTIAAQLLAEVWGETLAAGPERVRESIRQLFSKIAERLDGNPDAPDFYDELDQFELRVLADSLISVGILEQMSTLRASGGYLRYVPPSALARFFFRKPERWFGTVWIDTLADAGVVGTDAAANARQQAVGTFGRCLEDCAAYLRFNTDDTLILTRVRASGAFLEDHLA